MNMKIIAAFSFLMLYITATTSYMKCGGYGGYGCYGFATVPSVNARYSLRPKVSLLAMSDGTTDGYLKKLNIQHIMNTNVANVIKYTDCDQINITSVYLNIDKVKGVYFAKDVKNVIFTLPYDLSDLYYYDKNIEVIYKVSNKTRINMKGLDRFVFQSFNNNIDGIMF
jgi:hypothetical protein